MKAKKTRQRKETSPIRYGMIDFTFGDTAYQIDTTRRKVYHRWVEVETSKTCLIMGAFAQEQAQAK
jgi:hypothetical protein